MGKIISEIARELKEQFPEAFNLHNGIFMAKNITGLLVNEGYLYRGEDGKHPTELGEENGISEYWRTNNGEQFWQVDYDEQAEQLVHTIFEQQYSEVLGLNDGQIEMTVEHEHRYVLLGRTGANDIGRRHPGYMVFQEVQGHSWAFDENAQEICQIIGIEPHQNANGEYGVSFDSAAFDSIVVPKLRQLKRNYIINNAQEMEIVSFTAQVANAPRPHPPVQPVLQRPAHIEPAQANPAARPAAERRRHRTAVLGDYLTVSCDGETMNIYLATEETGNYQPIMHTDGGIEFVRVPTIEKDGIRILSPGSPLSQALIGKAVNDTVRVGDFSYRIMSIDQ